MIKILIRSLNQYIIPDSYKEAADIQQEVYKQSEEIIWIIYTREA